MFCWRARNLLSAHVDRELPAGRARAVARHLERCSGCAARERELRRVWDELAELPPPEAGADDLWPGIERRLAGDARPPALDERFRWWVPAAVAVSALLGVAGGTLFALRFAATSPRAAETVRAVATDDSFAEAFGEGPAELVNAVLTAEDFDAVDVLEYVQYADVLLIHEQELRPDTATPDAIGAAWAAVLPAWVETGGTVILLDSAAAETWRLLAPSGLVPRLGAGTDATGTQVAVVSARDPVARGVSTPYIAPADSTTFAVATGTCVVQQTTTGATVVLHRAVP